MAEWTEPTKIAIAQVTARLSDFRDESENLSGATFNQLVTEPGPDGADGALILSLGLMNLALHLLMKLSQVTHTQPEELLRITAQELESEQ